MNYQLPAIIFDPKCSLCLQTKMLIQKWDRHGKFNFISLYDPKLFEHFSYLNFDDCFGKVHLISKDQSVWIGSQAVEEVIRLLAPHPVVNKVLEYRMTRDLIGTGYDLFNSYRLKKAPSCEACRP